MVIGRKGGPRTRQSTVRRAGAIGQQYCGFEWLLFKRIDNIALLGTNERQALS